MRKLLLTRDQAGDLLGLSPKTIGRRIKAGLISPLPGDGRIALREILRHAVEAGVMGQADADSLFASAVETARTDVLEVIA